MQEYKIPLQLFDCEVESARITDEEIEENKQKLLKTLKGLGVEGKIRSFSVGPSFITYKVSVSAIIPLRKIPNYQDDISLEMGKRIRCYVDEHGSAFCVEVPRKNREFFELGQMIKENCLALANGDALTIILGKDGKNQNVTYDLTRLANMLIIGSVCSGKSVFLDVLITTLIYGHSPRDLKLVLSSLKEVTFAKFSGLPHLINEPANTPEEILKTLHCVVDEMESRYDLFRAMSESGRKVFNVNEYNQQVRDGQKLPKIVVVIDELSDLVYSCGRELHDIIMRLTQKARAVGIYLIVSMRNAAWLGQSLISNFPSRAAFRTSSKTDSYIVLECPDAENLSDLGDFLYLSAGERGIKRIQAPCIEPGNVKTVVDYIKTHYKADADMEMEKNIPDYDPEKEETDKEIDPCYAEALKAIIEVGRASISTIQRKCNIGFNKAALIIEWMEKNRYISELGDRRCREVLISMDEFENKFGKGVGKKE